MVKACDNVISLYKKDQEKKQQAIEALEQNAKEQQKRVDELAESNNAWHKNPFIWGAIGVLLGVLATNR